MVSNAACAAAAPAAAAAITNTSTQLPGCRQAAREASGAVASRGAAPSAAAPATAHAAAYRDAPIRRRRRASSQPGTGFGRAPIAQLFAGAGLRRVLARSAHTASGPALRHRTALARRARRGIDCGPAPLARRPARRPRAAASQLAARPPAGDRRETHSREWERDPHSGRRVSAKRSGARGPGAPAMLPSAGYGGYGYKDDSRGLK